MPDPLPHQVCQQTFLVDQISAPTHVLVQHNTRDLLRGPGGKMQSEPLMLRDNLGNREDLRV